jgi:hypothetical protein
MRFKNDINPIPAEIRSKAVASTELNNIFRKTDSAESPYEPTQLPHILLRP